MKLDFKHKCMTFGIIAVCILLYLLCFVLFPNLYNIFTSVIGYAGLITLLINFVFVHKLEEVPEQSKLVHNISILMCIIPLVLMLLIAGILSTPFQVRLLNAIIHRNQTRA